LGKKIERPSRGRLRTGSSKAISKREHTRTVIWLHLIPLWHILYFYPQLVHIKIGGIDHLVGHIPYALEPFLLQTNPSPRGNLPGLRDADDGFHENAYHIDQRIPRRGCSRDSLLKKILNNSSLNPQKNRLPPFASSPSDEPEWGWGSCKEG